jgi:hypothetical protein
MQWLRHQRVEVQAEQTDPSTPEKKAVILSRAQRAHYRLTWAERLARNARAPTASRVTIKLFGVPEDFATSLGQACLSEWSFMASFLGCSSISLIFCSFRLSSLWFCHLSGAGRPVPRGFRPPDEGLALQQPRCAIRGIRMSHLLGEPCADSLPASVRAITASRTISHASTARSAGSSLSEACDSSLKGSFEISSAMGPTPCHLCCSSS